MVPVALRGIHRWVPFHAFVDSGADYSVFHSDVASLIGFTPGSGEKRIVTVGDGDDMIVYLHTVTVRFADFVFKVPIGFSARLGSGFNLIGRETFFEKFQFCFNDKDRMVRVTRLAKKSH